MFLLPLRYIHLEKVLDIILLLPPYLHLDLLSPRKCNLLHVEFKLSFYQSNLLLITLKILISWLFLIGQNLRMLLQMTLLLMYKVVLPLFVNQNLGLQPLFQQNKNMIHIITLTRLIGVFLGINILGKVEIILSELCSKDVKFWIVDQCWLSR